MRIRFTRYLGYLFVATLIVVADQLLKHVAVAFLSGSPPIEVLPFLQWFLVYNSGAAFGFLHGAGGIQLYFFISVAIIVVGVILVWLWRVSEAERLLSFGLALILAGGIGNLIDRVRHQYVVDFINLHYQDWYFPAFNIADIAITFGVICYLIHAFRYQNSKHD
ncbi:MAG: signal peptidase II [Gammaproteobacteria bacterium]|nr:signal peptidase II [Gammaproteobacteria bacterium]MCY4218232.1 signal peptidase II [Gammaproteobacteria bacterium]MCY4273803.1 signal peptidase II [Gammaproteobacteria bacterium]